MNKKIDNFRDAVEARRIKTNKRIKEKYHLARSLGFSSYEAVVLAQRSKKKIIALAKQKDENN